MICPSCQIECVIGGMITRSGSKVVIERCPECRRNPNPQNAFLPKKNFEWESLPLLEDYSVDAPKCAVKGCENIGVEYHHFAPRHLFNGRADDWPTCYLCREHHTEWHELTKTGAYAKRTT